MSEAAARADEPISVDAGLRDEQRQRGAGGGAEENHEVLRIIREPFRLHLRPTMGLDR